MQFRLTVLTLIAFGLLALVGCGSTGTGLDVDIDGPAFDTSLLDPADAVPTDLELKPDASRAASDLQFTRNGTEYYNSRFATSYDGWAYLVSTRSQEAFARYRFGAVPVAEETVQLTLDIGGTQAFRVGYIDYDLQRWVWSGLLSGDHTIALPSGAVRPGDRAVFVDVRAWLGKKLVVNSLTVHTEDTEQPPIDPPAIDVEKWQGGATAAISLTFDDSTPDHWSAGLPLWEEYGFNVTLGILTWRFVSTPSRWPQLQQALDAGHELSNHTHNHFDMTSLSAQQLAEEFDACTALIEEHTDGYTPLTAIYPYTLTNETVEAAAAERFLFARGGDRGIADTTPVNDAFAPDNYNLLSYAPLNTLPMWQWNGTVDDALATGSWLIEQCHGIGTEGATGVGWSPRPVSEYEAHYDYIASKGSTLWVDTMLNVGRYIYSRQAAVVTMDAANEGYVEFRVDDEFDDALFNVPLTVRVEQIDGWDNVLVTQNGEPVEFTATGSGDWLIDVLPNATPVRISRL